MNSYQQDNGENVEQIPTAELYSRSNKALLKFGGTFILVLLLFMAWAVLSNSGKDHYQERTTRWTLYSGFTETFTTHTINQTQLVCDQELCNGVPSCSSSVDGLCCQDHHLCKVVHVNITTFNVTFFTDKNVSQVFNYTIQCNNLACERQQVEFFSGEFSLYIHRNGKTFRFDSPGGHPKQDYDQVKAIAITCLILAIALFLYTWFVLKDKFETHYRAAAHRRVDELFAPLHEELERAEAQRSTSS